MYVNQLHPHVARTQIADLREAAQRDRLGRPERAIVRRPPLAARLSGLLPHLRLRRDARTIDAR